MSEEKEVDFKNPVDNRDFALLVEGQKVYVNREFLACYSPVLRKIFYPEGAPFKQPEGGMLMKEKKLDEFLIFLQAVCPTQLTMKVDESSVALLLSYADEYDVWVLRDRCVEFIADQLKNTMVGDEVLIDYLRLAALYNLKGLQKLLVPHVAQLSIDKITAAHESLPLSVLSAVYQSKALALQAVVEGSPSLPENAFWCAMGCNSKTCSITKGASSCCNKRVVILATATAQINAQYSVSCGQCNKQCSLKGWKGTDYCHSSCCGVGVFVHPKTDSPSKHISAAAIHKAAANFSAILLDREK